MLDQITMTGTKKEVLIYVSCSKWSAVDLWQNHTRETNHYLVAVRSPCEEYDRKTLLLLITSRGIMGRHHFCSEELVWEKESKVWMMSWEHLLQLYSSEFEACLWRKQRVTNWRKRQRVMEQLLRPQEASLFLTKK